MVLCSKVDCVVQAALVRCAGNIYILSCAQNDSSHASRWLTMMEADSLAAWCVLFSAFASCSTASAARSMAWEYSGSIPAHRVRHGLGAFWCVCVHVAAASFLTRSWSGGNARLKRGTRLIGTCCALGAFRFVFWLYSGCLVGAVCGICKGSSRFQMEFAQVHLQHSYFDNLYVCLFVAIGTVIAMFFALGVRNVLRFPHVSAILSWKAYKT